MARTKQKKAQKQIRATRIGWDEYFLKLAMLISERSTCPRMHCGAVIVRNRRVLATGYNGSPPGLPHCDDVGCLVVDNHCQRTTHAELNAVIQAALHGVSIHGATLYATNMACTTCAKMLIGAGVERVVVFSHYHKTLASEFYRQAKVPIEILPMPDTQIRYDLKTYTSARKTKGSR